jgi:hypothetical protein
MPSPAPSPSFEGVRRKDREGTKGRPFCRSRRRAAGGRPLNMLRGRTGRLVALRRGDAGRAQDQHNNAERSSVAEHSGEGTKEERSFLPQPTTTDFRLGSDNSRYVCPMSSSGIDIMHCYQNPDARRSHRWLDRAACAAGRWYAERKSISIDNRSQGVEHAGDRRATATA